MVVKDKDDLRDAVLAYKAGTIQLRDLPVKYNKITYRDVTKKQVN